MDDSPTLLRDLHALVEEWKREAKRADDYGGVNVGDAIRLCARQLEELIRG